MKSFLVDKIVSSLFYQAGINNLFIMRTSNFKTKRSAHHFFLTSSNPELVDLEMFSCVLTIGS